MKDLLGCFDDWLTINRSDSSAYSIIRALLKETLKRVGSEDPSQREFDAEALAQAADGPDGFEPAKRWIDRARPELFLDARRSSIEQFFSERGHETALRVERRSPGGRHRAVWFLQAYRISQTQDLSPSGEPGPSGNSQQSTSARQTDITYEATAPGVVQVAWYAKPLLGAGSFLTRSWRGATLASVWLVPWLLIVFFVILAMIYAEAERPLRTSDFASFVLMGIMSWMLWATLIRPGMWLLEDRIVPAGAFWISWAEADAHLELARDQLGRQRLQLIRYTAVCPVCAAKVELRYAQGPNRRRLVGCCVDAPHDHTFSFDRILRSGTRLP